MIFSRWKIFNRYFCNNCGRWFRTGCYNEEEEKDPESFRLYDDICPHCGALSVPWYYCFSYLYCKLTNQSSHKKYLDRLYKKSKRGKNDIGTRKKN